MNDISAIIQENIPFSTDGNIVHFILNDEDRPWWSKQLDLSYLKTGEKLDMSENYLLQKNTMTSDPVKDRFVEFISNKSGIKVDLASGPSGYFSAALDHLTGDDVFIATDACPTVISAHAKACQKDNFFVFDVDLDNPLPFKDSSINLFSGNLLNNINNYAELLCEVYRCLKVGGHLAIIDMFFEHGCSTYKHLNDKGEIWASFETLVAFCEKIGFTFLNSEIISSRKGKLSDGDLYPLDENDNWCDRTLYFVKSENIKENSL